MLGKTTLPLKKPSFKSLVENALKNVKYNSLSFDKGDTLYSQGDLLDYVYYIQKGEVNVVQNNIAIWQAGQFDFVGLTSFFNCDSFYSCTIKALKNVEVAQIKVEEFKKLLNTNSAINIALMKEFCDRIDHIHRQVDVQKKLSRKKRLINLLIEKSKRLDKKEPLILDYSSSDIADFVNISKRFTKSILVELQNKKFIQLKKDIIIITDLKGLMMVRGMKGLMD